jgi:hypothetical protein
MTLPGIEIPATEVGIEIMAIIFFVKIVIHTIYGIFRNIQT